MRREEVNILDLSSQAIAQYTALETAFLEKVPASTFKVVELKPRTLKLQLNTFLKDEEDPDLFKELQSVSLNWEKLAFDDDNRNIKRGWAFEWIWDNELMSRLMEKSTGIMQVQPTAMLQEEPLQFVYKDERWVGLSLQKFPKGLPPSFNSWQLTYHKQWYWVAPAEKLIKDWIEIALQKSTSLKHSMAIAIGWQKMPSAIEQLGLVQWFRDWVNCKLSVSIVSMKNPYFSAWSADKYSHPADQWLEFYQTMPQEQLDQLLGGDAPGTTMAMAALAISEMKEDAARLARNASRKEAISKVRERFESREWTKAELLETAQAFDVTVKKSDSKPKMIDALLNSEKAQTIAENVLGIPND